MNAASDKLLLQLSALASPHRLAILVLLQRQGQRFVSELARELAISRPLLHLHLRKLQEADLVTSSRRFSEDGKALHYYSVAKFSLTITPQMLAKLGYPK